MALDRPMNEHDIIKDATIGSDIAFGTEVYHEVARQLIGEGLNLAFFVFFNSERSSVARTLDGGATACPLLTLYLRYDADVLGTGIDPHSGNWDDKWPPTKTVRDVLNATLLRHGFNAGYVAENTFVFVRSLEKLAFDRIGRSSVGSVRRVLATAFPSVGVDGVYWNNGGYFVLLASKADYKLVKRGFEAKVAKEVSKLLAHADNDCCCRTYSATFEFGYDGMVPAQFRGR